MQRFSYTDFFATAKRYPKLILSAIGVTLLLAFVWLNVTTPQYTGEMVLGPTSQTGVAARGARLPLEDIQNEKIRTTPAEMTADETLSDFSREIQLLTSPEIAARLLKDKDLQLDQNLLHQHGMMHGVKWLLWHLAGQSLQSDEDATSLSALLTSEVHVDTIGRSAMRKITFRHPNREFAVGLLNALYRASDAQLKEQAQTRTTAEIAYLRVALDHVTLADQRKAFVDLLAEQEQTQLLIAIDLPFAADRIQAATAPLNPDWPPVGLVLLFAFLLGAFAGFSVLYALAIREWQKKTLHRPTPPREAEPLRVVG
jgi:uncharacterized protein involved in exopolysaccharide biosynthesis